MNSNKKEKPISADAPIAEQALPYLKHRKRLNELDFKKAGDVEIAIYCLNVSPTMAKSLDVNVERELSILKIWVKRDYSNYLLCLKNRVEHIALLTLYLTEKLQKTLGTIGEEISLITSYDKKPVLNYLYETKRGETISYFDKALGVPTALTVTANLRLKLIDAQKLVEKIDVDIKYIDMAIVANFVTAVLSSTVRDTILAFIASENLSFYDLPQHYTEINGVVLEKLRKRFGECGLDAMEFSVSDISIPNNTGKLLQNQFFAIATAERVKAHEHRLEKESLDLYERKAAIHSKYPDFPITLTEAEKDFALDRYLRRYGQDTALKADIREEKLADREVVTEGTVTKERKVAMPTFTEKSNTFRFCYAISVVILYIIAFSMFAVGAGFATLAGVTFVSGITAVICFPQLKYGSKTKRIIDTEYAREGDMYIRQQEENAENDMIVDAIDTDNLD